jgi:hypothetical protein
MEIVMPNSYHRFAGWALCVGSVIMLAGLGKLDLLIVLLPVSILMTILSTRLNSRKDVADGRHGKGIA